MVFLRSVNPSKTWRTILQMPEKVVIADTSCLIALANISAIELLKDLYSKVYITKEIAFEFGEQLPEWIKQHNAENHIYQQLLEIHLDPGEASAIALAIEMDHALLIIDELKGMKEAKKLGLLITGTFGVLLKAKSIGLISELKPLLDKLKANGFRIAPSIENEILRKSNDY